MNPQRTSTSPCHSGPSPLVLGIIALGICLLSFVPAYLLRHDLVSTGDDASYASHALTLGLDFDLDYTNEVAMVKALFLTRDGNMISHPIGSGLLAAPFVALFSVVDRLTNHPILTDRTDYLYSWSYFACLFAANFYFLLGLALLWRGLKILFPGLTLPWLILMVFSSGITYYVLGRFLMSHGFEFFSLALLFFVSLRYWQTTHGWNLRSLLWALGLGASAVLCVWVRYNNLNALLLPFIVLTFMVARTHGSHVSLSSVLVALGAIAVCLVPYFAFSLHFFHGLFPTMAEVYSSSAKRTMTFDGAFFTVLRLLPNLVPLVLGSEYGLVYSLPVVVIGLATLVGWSIRESLAGRRLGAVFAFFALCFVYAGLDFAIVLYWQTTGSIYGYRYLFPLIPLGVLGTALLVEHLRRHPRKWTAKLGLAVVALSLVWGIVNVAFYRANPDLSNRVQVNIFGVKHRSSAMGYEVRLVEHVVSPATWVQVVGKSGLSLLVPPQMMTTPELRAFIPEKYQQSYLGMYEGVPVAVRIQAIVLLALWFSAGFLFQRHWGAQKDDSNTAIAQAQQ